MIRINLIGRKVKQKKTGNRSQLLIYVALLAVVFGVMFLWHQQLTDELKSAKVKSVEAADKIEKLKRVKQAWELWQAEKADIDSQADVFAALQADQLGPSTALQYLSYTLTKIPDEVEYIDETKAQELAAWNPKWDTRRVWIKSVEIKGQDAKIEGEALDHQDVAEFYRRLESSDIFRNISPGPQRRKVHTDLDIKFVEFSVHATVSYVAAATAWKIALEEAAKAAEAPKKTDADEAGKDKPEADSSGNDTAKRG